MQNGLLVLMLEYFNTCVYPLDNAFSTNRRLKDVPLALNEKKVISFGATANANSKIRTQAGSDM